MLVALVHIGHKPPEKISKTGEKGHQIFKKKAYHKCINFQCFILLYYSKSHLEFSQVVIFAVCVVKENMNSCFSVEMAIYSCDSVVRGYHIYKDIWEAAIGEVLDCRRERSIHLLLSSRIIL